ncbi:ankyrin repeat-containing domain protein, partial [Ochromonadaceae sp. CCMP2298]
LHEVVRGGDLAAVRDLIAAGAKIDERDKLKRTALHIAAWAGHFEIVQMLVRVNATLDVKAMDAFTPLHFAAQSSAPGAAECIRFLARKNKALLRMPITKGNKSPIHLAVAKGVKANIIALLEAGADPTAKTTSGQTALDLARTPEVRQLL